MPEVSASQARTPSNEAADTSASEPRQPPSTTAAGTTSPAAIAWPSVVPPA